MEGVKDIVAGINSKLVDSFVKNGIAQVASFGISETVDADKTSFPVFFKQNNGKWAGFDDKKSVILYHKLNSVSSAPVGRAYGDKNINTISNTYNMSLVVYFNSGKTKLMPDEMFAFIQAVMPEFLGSGDSKFTYIRTSVSNAILNSRQTFGQEYRGIAYSLKSEQRLISITYIIESHFKKGCFNCCSED